LLDKSEQAASESNTKAKKENALSSFLSDNFAGN
jgi:hypothetical protein